MDIGASPFDLGMAEMQAIFTHQLTSDSTQRSRTTSASVVSDNESISNVIGTSWPLLGEDEVLEPATESLGHGLLHHDELEPNGDTAFDLLGSFGMPGTNSSPTAFRSMAFNSAQHPLFQPVSWKPPLPFTNTAETVPLQSPSHISRPSFDASAPTQASVSVSEMSSTWNLPITQRATSQNAALPSEPAECPFHKIGTDDKLVGLLKSYIQTMLHKGRYPPFVHPKLYKCVEGDVIESLANAFCSLAAKNAAVPSSESFVNLMINSERSRLIKAFRSWGKSDVEGLAAIHAMSIYQITSFFDSTAEQARLAELQQPFFLKMARRLAQQFLLPEQIIVPEPNEATWRRWILLESLKRALLVVNIINTLGYRTQQMNGFYYEPLGDEMVLNLRAPAPDVLWSARSAQDWASKYAQLDQADQILSTITIRQLRDSLNPTIAQSPSVPKLRFDQLSEFTQLTLACLIVDLPDD